MIVKGLIPLMQEERLQINKEAVKSPREGEAKEINK